MKSVLKITFIALACTMAVAPAAAQPGESSTIRFRDLDLGTEQGVARLDRRIGRAARSICGTANRSLFEIHAVKPCLEQVAESAARAVAEARSADSRTASAELDPHASS